MMLKDEYNLYALQLHRHTLNQVSLKDSVLSGLFLHIAPAHLPHFLLLYTAYFSF